MSNATLEYGYAGQPGVIDLLGSIERVTQLDEITAIMQHPNVDENILLECLKFIESNEEMMVGIRNYLLPSNPLHTLLVSDKCNDSHFNFLNQSGLYYFLRVTLLVAYENNICLNEPALYLLATSRDARDNVTIAKWLSSQVNIGERTIQRLAKDYRVTIRRLAAKHPLLKMSAGEHLMTDDDITVRKLIIKQSWISNSNLYFMRDDPDSLVSQAALKEITKRGLPLLDEIDNVMGDEVSLFFLTGSGDEETLLRLAANPGTPASVLRDIAFLNNQVMLSVAGNVSAPLDLLNEFTNSENRPLLRFALAKNPSTSSESLSVIVDNHGWDKDVLMSVLKNPNCPPSVVTDRYYGSSARIFVAALNTGFMPEKKIDYTLKYEYRDLVLKAIIQYEHATVQQLTRCYYVSSSTATSEKALQRLLEMGVTLE